MPSNHSRLALGGALRGLHDRPALGLVGVERRRHVAPPRPSEIASSIASLVPEPIEKCAVCAASPSSTTFPWRQNALRTVTKLIHCACWRSADGRPAVGEQLLARLRGSLGPSPRPRQVSSVVSTMNVLRASLYG